MYTVIITYTNGERIKFTAQQFDVHWEETKHDKLQKLKYQDYKGNDCPIYLTLGQVAGITVSPSS